MAVAQERPGTDPQRFRKVHPATKRIEAPFSEKARILSPPLLCGNEAALPCCSEQAWITATIHDDVLPGHEALGSGAEHGNQVANLMSAGHAACRTAFQGLAQGIVKTDTGSI